MSNGWIITIIIMSLIFLLHICAISYFMDISNRFTLKDVFKKKKNAYLFYIPIIGLFIYLVLRIKLSMDSLYDENNNTTYNTK